MTRLRFIRHSDIVSALPPLRTLTEGTMRIRNRRRPHHRPYKDLTNQTEAEALANFKEFREEYWSALSHGRRQDVVNRFVLMEMTADHCQETFGRAPVLPVLPDDYRQELEDTQQAMWVAASVIPDDSDAGLTAFLKDTQQQAIAAGLTAPPSPEEKARYAKLVTQIYEPLNEPCPDLAAVDVGLCLQHTPLWAVYGAIGYFLQGVTSDMRAHTIRLVAEVPTEQDMAGLVAVHLKMMTDLLRLTEGWDITARRSATLAQLGLPPPEPPPRLLQDTPRCIA